MKDAESKIALIAYYVEGIARIACAIPDAHLARVYGRSLFLGVDSFLNLAPRLKNEMKKRGALTGRSAKAISQQIKKLHSDYNGYYETVRDKLSAHQQELDLSFLLETWNEIDAATLTILSDDVSAIWASFQRNGAVSTFPRPQELDDATSLSVLFTLTNPSKIQLALDRVGLTRANTSSIIPTGPFQEKPMRILTAFDCYQTLIKTGLEQIISKWPLPQKACIDLFVVDACSIIDNIFEDRIGTTQVTAEDSLVKIWKNHNVHGIDRLENFQRDSNLEQKIRELRNKFSAHVDPDIALLDLNQMFVNFPLQEVDSYLHNIHRTFQEVCQQDNRTRIFLSHRREIKGVVGIADTGAVKPFR